VNFRKLSKAMQKTGVEYDIKDMDAAIQIRTDPDKNEIAQKNIETSLGKYETCINSVPGKFNVIETDIRVYRIPVEPDHNLES